MTYSLEEARRVKHERWLKDWHQGLAFCRNCDNEYTDAQTVLIDEQKFCPHCREPEDKKYYYCPEDGSSKCDCEK